MGSDTGPRQAEDPSPSGVWATGRDTGAVFFDLDSPALRASTSDMVSDGRMLLEVFLAGARGMVLAPEAHVEVHGYASPQHDAEHNRILSLARAATVAGGVQRRLGWPTTPRSGDRARGRTVAPGRTGRPA